MSSDRNRLAGLVARVSMLWLVTACQEDPATFENPNEFPVDAVTFEVELLFDEFAKNSRVIGGYSAPIELPQSFVATELQGALEARTLVRFDTDLPRLVTARGPDGTVQFDSIFSVVGGRVILKIDTVTSTDVGAQIRASATTARWEPISVGWEVAVDTLGDFQPWPEPGGGPASFIEEVSWDPVEGDSLVIPIDSATVNQWLDSEDDTRGLRLEGAVDGPLGFIIGGNIFDESPEDFGGSRIELDIRPSIDPDTLVTDFLGVDDMTFIYSPELPVVEDKVRVGGVPASRWVFEFDLPETVDPPAAVCLRFECPIPLTAGALSNARLVLTSAESEAGFQPADSVVLDVRQVLAPSVLPKSPLGFSLLGAFGRRLPPEYFAGESGTELTLGVTNLLLLLLLSGEDNPVPETVAILSQAEPEQLGYGSFVGPGEAGGPILRLVLTVTDDVRFPR